MVVHKKIKSFRHLIRRRGIKTINFAGIVARNRDRRRSPKRYSNHRTTTTKNTLKQTIWTAENWEE